jgi:hypothetical protein
LISLSEGDFVDNCVNGKSTINECIKAGDQLIKYIQSKYRDPLSSIDEELLPNDQYTKYFDKAKNESTNEILIKTYKVNADSTISSLSTNDQLPKELIPLKDDISMHQKIWADFTHLIPKTHHETVGEYAISTDGYDGIAASIGPLQQNLSKMGLYVDPLDFRDKIDGSYTLIHEFGHMLSINDKQIDYYKGQQDCHSTKFIEDTGCSNESSYLNIYFNRFWIDFEEEWRKADISSSTDLEKQESFFLKHPTRFVTPYSTTNMVEDFAESFTYFVLQETPKDKSEITKQKLLFFHEFPELVILRTELLNNFATLLDKDKENQQSK